MIPIRTFFIRAWVMALGLLVSFAAWGQEMPESKYPIETNVNWETVAKRIETIIQHIRYDDRASIDTLMATWKDFSSSEPYQRLRLALLIADKQVCSKDMSDYLLKYYSDFQARKRTEDARLDDLFRWDYIRPMGNFDTWFFGYCRYLIDAEDRNSESYLMLSFWFCRQAELQTRIKATDRADSDLKHQLVGERFYPRFTFAQISGGAAFPIGSLCDYYQNGGCVGLQLALDGDKYGFRLGALAMLTDTKKTFVKQNKNFITASDSGLYMFTFQIDRRFEISKNWVASLGVGADAVGIPTYVFESSDSNRFRSRTVVMPGLTLGGTFRYRFYWSGIELGLGANLHVWHTATVPNLNPKQLCAVVTNTLMVKLF